MYIIKSMLISSVLCMSNIVFALPANNTTTEKFFSVSDIKATVLNNLQDKDLAILGLDKESFWQELKPELITIYSSNFTEEELQTTIEYYQNPDVQLLLKKMPKVSKMSNDMTMRILLKHALNKSLKTK